MEFIVSFLNGWWRLIVTCWSEWPLVASLLSFFIIVISLGSKGEDSSRFKQVCRLFIALLIWAVAVPVVCSILKFSESVIDFLATVYSNIANLLSMFSNILIFYYSIYENHPRFVFMVVAVVGCAGAIRFFFARGSGAALSIPKIILSVLLLLAIAKPFL